MIYRDGVKWSAAASVFSGFQDVVEDGMPADPPSSGSNDPSNCLPSRWHNAIRGTSYVDQTPGYWGRWGVNRLNRARSFSWPQSSPGSFYRRTWIPKYRPPNTKIERITTTSQ